ncbi:MAG: Crp/Fnr family transcriptional regulator [Bacteroidota bacterium]
MPLKIDNYHFSRFSVLEGLPEDESRLLKEKMIRKEIKKGQLIYRQGSFPRGVYFLRKGKVKIYQTNSEGKEQIIYIYTRGESFGYRPILSAEPHPVSAKALEDSVLSFVPAQSFIRLLNRSSVLPNILLRALSREFSVWANHISVFAQKSVRERLALALLILNEKYKRKDKGHLPPVINLSRDDLANYVGTAKETLVRMLQNFKEKKIIRTEGRRIIVLDPAELENISDLF